MDRGSSLPARPPPCCTLHTTGYRAGCRACAARAHWCTATRRKAIAAGRWQPMGDAALLRRVREHIAACREAGATVPWIAQRSGVSERSVQSAATDAKRRCIRPDIAAAILAVPPPATPLPPRGFVHVAGTARRVMGLAVDGWSLREQARRLGLSRRTLSAWLRMPPTGHVRATLAAKVALLAQELGDLPCDLPRASRARGEAARHGWHSLDAWADIDDPHCQPVDGSGLLDEVLVELILAGRGLRLRPACWPEHHRCGPRPDKHPCQPCRVWRVNRDAAIRSSRLSIDQLAQCAGESGRTISRIRSEGG